MERKERPQYPLESFQFIRDGGNIQYNVKELFKYYQYSDPLKNLSAERSRAFLICLCIKVLGINYKSDIVLVSWRLLEGYDDSSSITERREKYLRESGFRGARPRMDTPSYDELSAVEQKTKADALRKKEDLYYEEIVKGIENENFERILGLAKKYYMTSEAVNSRARLPKPSYAVCSWKRLPPRNEWFTGREAILSEIEKGFNSSQYLQILHGMCGMGKTQIAKEYAYTHKSKYAHIYWIDATSLSQIKDSYSEILSEFSVNLEPENKTDAGICGAFIKLIEGQPSWLIIFDHYNLSNPTEIKQFRYLCIPKKSKCGHILITTRSRLALGKAKQIEINMLPEQDAVLFLLQRTGTSNEVQARLLARQLECYPLSLEIAAERICSNPSLNMGNFAAELRDKPELLEEESGIITDYPVTIYRMFKDTIDHIKVDRENDVFSENIEGFLTLCAFLLLPDIEVTVFDQFPEIVDAGKKIGDLPKDISKTECLDLSQIIQLCQDKASIGKLIEIATDYGLIIQSSRKIFYLLKPLSLLIRHYADPESKYIATKTVCLVLETLAEESDDIKDKIELASYLKDACHNRNSAVSLAKNTPGHPISPEHAICVAELAYHSLHCRRLEQYRTEDLSKYHQMLLDEVDQQSLMFPIYFYDSYEQFGFYGLSLFLHQLINAIMAETGYSEFLNALHIAQVGFEAILTAANNAGFDAFFEFYKGPDNAANVIWNEHYLIKRRRYFAQLFDPFPVISLAETALTAWMLYGDGDESEIIARDEQINRRKQGRHPVGIAACIKNMEPILIVYKEKEKVIDEVYNDFMDNIRAYQNKDISLIPRRLYDSAIKTFETEECNKSEEIRKQYTAVRQEKEKRAAPAREKNGN